MRASIRQIFRPVYGRYCQVRPRRWWSREERKIARLMAIMLDDQCDRIFRRAVDAWLYG